MCQEYERLSLAVLVLVVITSSGFYRDTSWDCSLVAPSLELRWLTGMSAFAAGHNPLLNIGATWVSTMV